MACARERFVLRLRRRHRLLPTARWQQDQWLCVRCRAATARYSLAVDLPLAPARRASHRSHVVCLGLLLRRGALPIDPASASRLVRFAQPTRSGCHIRAVGPRTAVDAHQRRPTGNRVERAFPAAPVAIFLAVLLLSCRERRMLSLVVLAIGILSVFVGLTPNRPRRQQHAAALRDHQCERGSRLLRKPQSLRRPSQRHDLVRRRVGRDQGGGRCLPTATAGETRPGGTTSSTPQRVATKPTCRSWLAWPRDRTTAVMGSLRLGWRGGLRG